MLIHSILDSSTVNGPGNRMVIWTQGCELRCPGCWNTETHKFQGKPVTVQERLTRILPVLKNLDGITFSGGEPLHQLDDGLDFLVYELHQALPALSIGLYTGYTEQELEAGNYRETLDRNSRTPKYKKAEGWQWLKQNLDFAVMGRYNQNEPDTSRPLCSSRNQKLVLFSHRYKLEDFAPQQYEVLIEEEGLVNITGFPPKEIYARPE